MPLSPPQDYRKTAYTHRRGTAAARPAAADVLPGTLYYSTDTLVLERSTGVAWESYAFNGILTVDNIQTGLTSDGLRIQNTTAATLAIPLQYSPNLNFKGTAWDTDDAVSRVIQKRIQLRTFSGASQAGALYISHDDGNGVFADHLAFGNVIIGDSVRLALKDANLLFSRAGRGIGFVAAPLTDALDTNFAFSGDVSGGLRRLIIRTCPGYLFVESNAFGSGAGVVPSIDIRGFDDSVSSPIVYTRRRSVPGGSVANGFGGRELWQASSSTTNDQNQGAIDIVWNDVTHATRSADFVISLVNNAAALAEKLRLTSAGNLNVASYSVGGTAGAAGGTFAPPTSITVVNGLVTAIS